MDQQYYCTYIYSALIISEQFILLAGTYIPIGLVTEEPVRKLCCSFQESAQHTKVWSFGLQKAFTIW